MDLSQAIPGALADAFAAPLFFPDQFLQVNFDRIPIGAGPSANVLDGDASVFIHILTHKYPNLKMVNRRVWTRKPELGKQPDESRPLEESGVATEGKTADGVVPFSAVAQELVGRESDVLDDLSEQDGR